MPTSNQAYHFLRTPIQIYSSYRFLLSILFLGIAISKNQGNFYPFSLGLTISFFYFIFALLFFAISLRKSLPIMHHTFIGFIIDIASIALLEYTSLHQGLSLDLILIVSVAAGSIVFSGKLGMAIAAIAAISLCAKAFFLNHLFNQSDPNNLRTAILGITFFATAWISQTLAKRLVESEAITSRQAKDIQHLQKLNEAIIERMHTGIAVFNQDNQIQMMNQAATRLLSEDPATSIDPAPGLLLLFQKTQQWLNNEYNEQQTIQLSDHAPEIKLGFSFLGSDKYIVVFLEDNTKLKQHAQKLKLASLGRLAASIAHEIRNPLAAVSYANELLEETAPTEEQIRLLQILKKHVRRMNDIVNNVLQISRREPPAQEKIPINPWLKNFLNAVFPHMKNIQLKSSETDSLIIDFDASHLSQVCTNLIENAHNAVKSAVKSNKTEPDNNKEPAIYIETGYIPNLNRAYLNITDEGPGIPVDKRAEVFEPFFTTTKTGSGLGLFLCREICELNHARIHILPTVKDTCFQILFKPRNFND